MRLFDKKPESFLNSKHQTHWNCAYHQGERITNFCLSDECLLPLCPQCVKVHLQEHSKMNVHGHFDVIENVVSSVKGELTRKLERTQKMKSIIETLGRNKGHELQDILGNLKGFKAELFAVINEHFKSLEEEIKENIINSHEKLKEEIDRNIIVSSNLMDTTKKNLEALSGSNCMEAIISNFTELRKKQINLDESCKKIQLESLTRNVLNINRNFLIEIGQQISSGIELTSIQLPQFQLINVVGANLSRENSPKENASPNYSLAVSGIRQGLTEIKQNDVFYSNDKVQTKLQDGLFQRLTKTTERLQNDLENLRRSEVQNRPIFG